MQSFIQAVDRLSTWVGHAFAWCVMVMTLGIGFEVFMRSIFNNPTTWAYDLSYIMFGSLFMMGGAYTLSRDGHVRGDVFYHRWQPRTQARIELTLYIIFFFPAMIALMFAGWEFAAKSMSYNGGRGEVSSFSPANVPIWQFKLIIPAAGLLLFIQGLAQVCRCIICIKTGDWPPRIEDVEETETILKHQAEDHAQVEQLLTGDKDKGQQS